VEKKVKKSGELPLVVPGEGTRLDCLKKVRWGNSKQRGAREGSKGARESSELSQKKRLQI